MKLGDKPLAEMSPEECLEAITTLRAEREELRSEAIRKKKDHEAGISTRAPRIAKVLKQKPTVDFPANILAFLKGETDELKSND